jgi:hypothetical protein
VSIHYYEVKIYILFRPEQSFESSEASNLNIDFHLVLEKLLGKCPIAVWSVPGAQIQPISVRRIETRKR